ncbi:4-hydroxybenzoate 3-monooxygenase [Roseinatronobacter alkalisoli]|uniref:4-hydroxybenzoate 3-monooxygenase n=1 Tax=Roseinatronobacter alkalisoli TaxID=3028235 RepID=A0ABT5T5A6_9RHOB|nr:4-hydroxybenzoate 3-monooxygenase [Roseinatronobacter sp. HJB301]MDD7969571.1 4-hydroxybenzoate 3-monooxygenase [Roseinatronobacter sp. HJB301]
MRTQVAIIGGGPSGLLLSQLLNRAGIETVVLERQSRAHVLSRIRAGVLERCTVDLLNQAGAGARMQREGYPHDGCYLSSDQKMIRVDFQEACGHTVMVYGQTEVTRDLYDAQDALGATHIHGVENVVLHDLKGAAPSVTWDKDGESFRLECDFIAGCDGFHGVSRRSIPDNMRREYEKVYPFGWLGVLSETPPVRDELIYANHPRGFALASMRNPMLSRYYIQVPLSDKAEDWSDDAFWTELKARLPQDVAADLVTGASIEKSIAPLRSFVSEPLRWGALFLCGDAAHIVPPTGAKGLNLATSDVHYLSQGLLAHYNDNDPSGLDSYSQKALARIWKAMRFSWSVTTMMHRFPEHSEYDRQMQRVELDMLATDPTARKLFAENYTGTPL